MPFISCPRGKTISQTTRIQLRPPQKARQTLADLRKLSEQRYVSPFETALTYIGLGDKEHAFEWLEKALADHSWGMIWLRVDPRLDDLRGDQRFASLLRRMGLPP